MNTHFKISHIFETLNAFKTITPISFFAIAQLVRYPVRRSIFHCITIINHLCDLFVHCHELSYRIESAFWYQELPFAYPN